jgi:biotin operon repressor
MLEMVSLMKDGDIFSRELFDKALNASKPSITVNIRKLKENGVIKPADQRGKYIVCIPTVQARIGASPHIYVVTIFFSLFSYGVEINQHICGIIEDISEKGL